MSQLKVSIDGMTCRSCEILIEKKFRELPGVKKADVSSRKGEAHLFYEGEPPAIEALDAVVRDHGYAVRAPGSEPARLTKRPSLFELAGLFLLVLLIGRIATNAGWLDAGFSVSNADTGFWPFFVVGLVAAASSCLAVTGGLLLSTVSTWSGGSKFAPTALFVAGRVVSYALFGGLIAMIGKTLMPSPFATGLVMAFAAVYMLVMGLDMLRLAPRWLTRLMPKMPKFLARGAAAQSGPFMMGAATFFIPCGFTQAFQIYALTTGSFAAGASALGAFALGTAPALFAVGWASGAFKGGLHRFVMKFSGALVIVMGIWNLNNGLTLSGLRVPKPEIPAAMAAAEDANVVVENGTQVIRMGLGFDPYYPPSDVYTVRAGMPVRMEIAGPGTGCRGQFVIPRLGVRLDLVNRLNVVEFTPKKNGTYVFSCAMGMFPGLLNVVSS